ncbi:MAG: ATP-binding protein [Opitutales bacterium]
MIRLLLITDDTARVQTLTAALSSGADLQVVTKSQLAEARGALAAGAFDACLLQPVLAGPDFCTDVAAARTAFPSLTFIVVLPPEAAPDTQARLLTAGVDQVLQGPVEPALLASHLGRLAARLGAPAHPAASLPGPGRTADHSNALASALGVLRDFSQVLGFSLDHRQLTQHFIVRLREVVGLTRIAIFLEPAAPGALPGAPAPDPSRLDCVASVGLPADLVECFSLSRKSGLGRQLTQHPQILRAPTSDAASPLDPRIAREFEVLGGQIAIPVNDRERTLGIAVLGGRITGAGFSDEELLLVYHLLEELGLAVKNSWLHSQLVGSHELLTRVLDGLTVGALVAGPHSQVLYANRAIAGFLRGPGAVTADIHDLPPAIARRLHDAIEKGAAIEPFFHEPPAAGGPVYRVTLIPLAAGAGRLPRSALLLLEDFTSVRTAQQAEIESSNLRLISLIARRFAHEIRNALVPLTTHAQLFDTSIGDAEFQASLKAALDRETQRIQRFTDQMLLLARSDQPAAELVPLDEMLRGSFEKSRLYAGGGDAELEISTDLPSVMLRCHQASLAHAFQEIFLNGLQSGGPGPRRLHVALHADPTPDGRAELCITVRDSGGGFAADSAPRATEPFFTTRNTGVGLGLTIARRVIEAHQGRLDVHTRGNPSDPDLTIRLPLPR